MSFATVRALVIAGALASVGCQPVASPVTQLAEGEINITGIAVDEFSLYFIKSDGQVKGIPLDGGDAAPLTTGELVDPRHIALGADFVYLGTSGGTLARVPKGSGDVEALLAGQPAIKGLAADTTHVYFASGDQLRKMALVDQEETSLAASAIEDGTLVKNGGALYWVDGSPGSVRTVQADAVGAAEPGIVQTGAKVTAVDGNFIYWAATDTEDPQLPYDTLYRKRHDGSESCRIARSQAEIFKIVSDEDNVYWTSKDGSVSTAPPECDSTPFVFSFLSDGDDEAVFLAQDAAYVYYARSKTGTIWARPKGSLVTQ